MVRRRGGWRTIGEWGVGSGGDVPLLAGVVQLGPLADERAVRGAAVGHVQRHAAVDVADRVVAAGRGDVPLLAGVAQRRPELRRGAVADAAVLVVQDLAAVDVGDGVVAVARTGELPLLAGVAERGPDVDRSAVGGTAVHRVQDFAGVGVGQAVGGAGDREVRRRGGVSDGRDVGLYGVVGGVGRVAGGHDALEEGAV